MRTMQLQDGDTVLVTGSVPELLVGGTNFIKIHEIGKLARQDKENN